MNEIKQDNDNALPLRDGLDIKNSILTRIEELKKIRNDAYLAGNIKDNLRLAKKLDGLVDLYYLFSDDDDDSSNAHRRLVE